jgi:hypothetical protein
MPRACAISSSPASSILACANAEAVSCARVTDAAGVKSGMAESEDEAASEDCAELDGLADRCESPLPLPLATPLPGRDSGSGVRGPIGAESGGRGD